MTTPAAHRRGDDVAHAHGGEDRAGLLGAGRPRARRVAGGRRRRARSSTATGGDAYAGRRSATSTRRSAASARGRQAKERYLTIAEARANRVPIDWSTVAPPRPTFLGVRTFDDYPLAELVERIDWTPFFATWELRGAYPAILDDPQGRRGGARPVSTTPARCWTGSSPRSGCAPRGVVGFWPANADGDDIARLARR